jgi:hypothetical protein
MLSRTRKLLVLVGSIPFFVQQKRMPGTGEAGRTGSSGESGSSGEIIGSAKYASARTPISVAKDILRGWEETREQVAQVEGNP